MKKTWTTINETLNRSKHKNGSLREITVNGESVKEPREIANHFNEFFSNIGTNLSNNIPSLENTRSFTEFLINPADSRFNFQFVTEDVILSIINKLKNKKSSGKDELSNKLLKSIKHEISLPLTIIINQSLSTGVFPEALKIEKVKPLYKKGDKLCINNYRPISLLPTISKVFERVLHTQLYDYFNTNKLLSEQQYGFRTQHSTELAAIKLVDNIILNLDDRKHVKTPTALFLDLSKAFDTLNFDILLHKLQFYGIVGVAYNLIKSYLTSRYQYVQFENVDSKLLEIKTGIQ